MDQHEKADATAVADATVTRGAGIEEYAAVKGRYAAECIGPDGEVKWSDECDNVVTDVGARHMLDTEFAGSSYTVVGPYIGLISNVSYAAGPVAADTMASHAGWTEAGGTNAPTYTAPRKTAAWNAASGRSKALSAALTFAITSGTNVIIKGMFMVLGTGALTTIDNTAGTLYSAGVFTGGDKTVSSGDTLNVSWTGSA